MTMRSVRLLLKSVMIRSLNPGPWPAPRPRPTAPYGTSPTCLEPCPITHRPPPPPKRPTPDLGPPPLHSPRTIAIVSSRLACLCCNLI